MDTITLYFGCLLVAAMVEAALLVFVFWRTPAWTFLWGGLTGRMIAIHPRENKYAHIIALKREGVLGKVKERGYYIINPADVYIETKSKMPLALIYGNSALTIDLGMAKLAEHLKELGIKYYTDLANLIDVLKAQGQTLKITVFGESVDVSQALNYFSTTERTDLIEAEIQRRTAAQMAKKLGGAGDIFRWAVVLVIILIGAAIAYTAIMQNSGNAAQNSALLTALQNMAHTAAPIQTAPTSGAGVVIP